MEVLPQCLHVSVLTRKSVRRSILLLVLVALPTSRALATPQDVATAVPIDQTPTIDGVLDEPFWERIAPITDFKQREPNEGAAPSEPTAVRIAYDDDFIYFGLTMFDSQPDRIRRTILQREGRIDQDDRVIIGLDTYFDRRNAYIFELNAFGTQGDALVTDESQINWDWEGVYRSEGRVTDFGWVLEVAIPFTTLRYGEAGAPRMGIAFYRSIRRKEEEIFWPLIGVDFRRHIFQVSQYAELEGLRDLKRQHHLEVKPYGLVGATRPGPDGPETEAIKDAGLDVKWGLTPNFTLDLTANTDFAHVEADNVQINLNRFNLFFPEKREFFLERAGLFSFGNPREAATFFSRRIGLRQGIVGGARLAGQSGAISLGLLNIQTEDAGDLEGQNFIVARVRADVRDRATVGAIFTNVQGGGAHNRVAGGDVRFRFFQSSELNAWVSKVWTPEQPVSSAAGSVNLNLTNDLFALEADYLNVGQHFDPGIGFVRRRDMVRYQTNAAYTPRLGSGDSLVRQLRFNAGVTYIEGQDHRKQTTRHWGVASVRFESGEQMGVDVNREFDRPERAFQLFNTVTIPAGGYTYSDSRFWFRSNVSRRLQGAASLRKGGFFDGHRTSYAANALYKFSEYLSVGANVSHDVFRFPDRAENVSTTLLGFNVGVAANRDLFSSALIQYDTVSRNLQANIRVNWIHTPGSDLFVVFNTAHRFFDGPRPFDAPPDARAGVVKLTYLLAF